MFNFLLDYKPLCSEKEISLLAKKIVDNINIAPAIKKYIEIATANKITLKTANVLIHRFLFTENNIYNKTEKSYGKATTIENIQDPIMDVLLENDLSFEKYKSVFRKINKDEQLQFMLDNVITNQRTNYIVKELEKCKVYSHTLNYDFEKVKNMYNTKQTLCKDIKSKVSIYCPCTDRVNLFDKETNLYIDFSDPKKIVDILSYNHDDVLSVIKSNGIDVDNWIYVENVLDQYIKNLYISKKNIIFVSDVCEDTCLIHSLSVKNRATIITYLYIFETQECINIKTTYTKTDKESISDVLKKYILFDIDCDIKINSKYMHKKMIKYKGEFKDVFMSSMHTRTKRNTMSIDNICLEIKKIADMNYKLN